MDAATVEARLQAIEDRDAIWSLVCELAERIDRRDLLGFAALFSRDGTLRTSLGPASTGPGEIQAFLEGALDRPAEHERSYHHVTNCTIAVDGDRATSSSRWSNVGRDAEDRPVVQMAGHYEDAFVREDGRWRFASRAIHNDIPYTRL
jgi:uncharacterized protein (TIGR02246 family)